MGIYEKALEIKAQLDTLKTNLGLSADTPLTDVVNSASSGGGGGAPTTNDIYRVKTIAQRDALTGVPQNAICVVTDKSQGALTEDAVFTKLSFATSVTLPTAIGEDEYIDATFRSEDDMIDFRCSLNSYGMNVMIWSMDTGESFDAMYETTDGITFELIGSVTEFELSSPVHCEYGWDDRFGLFMTTTVETFDGIFIRERNSWNPAYVGATATEQDIFAPSTALTNSGKITGGLNKAKWSKHNIYVQEEEPTDEDIDNNAVWIVPSSKVQEYEKEYLNTKDGTIKFTSTDIAKKAQINLVGANTYKFNSSFGAKQRGDYTCLDYTYLTIDGTASNGNDSKAVYCNGATYILTYSSSLKRFGKLDNTMGTYTPLTVPSLSSGGEVVGELAATSDYVFGLYKIGSTLQLLTYSIMSKAWTIKQLSINAEKTEFKYFIIPIDFDECLLVTFNTDAYALEFRTVNFLTATVNINFQINYTSDISYTQMEQLRTALQNFYFTRDGEYLTSFDELVELDLYDITKETILTAFDPYIRKEDRVFPNTSVQTIKHQNLIFARSMEAHYNVYKAGVTQRLLYTGSGDRVRLEPLYICDDILYLRGDDWNIYSMNLTQELPIVPATYGVLFQTGVSENRVLVCEGVEVDFINVALPTAYYYNNDDMGVAQVYRRKLNYSTYEYEWVKVLDNTAS